MSIGEQDELLFDMDIVLESDETGEIRAVLDTKYKAPQTPSKPDIHQIVTYAVAQGCNEAILIYPAPLQRPIDVNVGGIRVRSLSFRLDRDLSTAGAAFLADLLPLSSV